MTLAEFSDLAQIAGAVGVIASLVFVGVQLRQNTRQMQRHEGNAAMAQGSALRHLLLENREVAELLVAAIRDTSLEQVDEIRLNTLFSEMIYMARQSLHRVRLGFSERDEFERGVVPQLAPILSSRRAVAWWRRTRSSHPQEFVAAMEAAIPALRPQLAPEPAPSAKAEDPAESAVAPSGDAG